MCDRRAYAVLGALLVVTAAAHAAHAQGVDRRYVEEPTGGSRCPWRHSPASMMRAVFAANPGGLALIRGTELALVLGLEDPDIATSAGPGFGAYAARVFDLPLLSRSRSASAPSGCGRRARSSRPTPASRSGSPSRSPRTSASTSALACPGTGSATAARSTARRPSTSGCRRGGAITSRSAPCSATSRPRRSGARGPAPLRARGRAAPTRARFARARDRRPDRRSRGRPRWLGAAVDAGHARITVHLGAETRELHAVDNSPTGLVAVEGRDVRALVGLELSFGSTGVTTIASGLRDDAGDRHFLGGQVVLRSSTLGPASVLGTRITSSASS